MDKNEYEKLIKLLDEAYKTVRMGSFAIDCIIDKIENQGLEDLLRKQNAFYLDITEALESKAEEYKHQAQDINMMLKGTSFASINAKTLFNKETSHIAQMLIDGTTMGITTTIKARNEHPISDNKLLKLVDDIVSNLEKFVESLKDYL